MQQSLTILMAQINPTVGAIEANADKIIAIIENGQQNHDLIAFPELVLSGYPPEDLLFRDEFHARVEQALEKIRLHTTHCHVIIGHPSLEHGNCYNSATVFYQGNRVALYHKQNLPNYSVFDEKRYFVAGQPDACIIEVKGNRLGLCICEDAWQKGPVEQLIHANANVLLSLNASPFEYEKPHLRENLLRPYAKQGLAILYVNQIGGQDELVFDGQSFAMDSQGIIRARAASFKEELLTLTIEGETIHSTLHPVLDHDESIYEALVCGTRDYVEKNGFSGVLLGLSGGIDSALTLTIAVDALGSSRVHALMMPSRFSASMSLEDAKILLQRLGVEGTVLSIEPAFTALLDTLEPSFKDLPKDTTEENLQARIRGLLLMAFSNKTGKLVLTTSNKSESAVGYTTLYGDMAGGFAVLKDVLKTQVYALAHYRNRKAAIIPDRVIRRPPSAELAEQQTDQDSLPDYGVLDSIINDYMENKLAAADLIQKGYQAEIVTKVIGLIRRNEYKRRQAPPGIKISSCAFGRDWRYPITSKF